jgi:hypothetical protein
MHGLAVDGPEGGAGQPAAASGPVEIINDLAASQSRLVGQVPAVELEDIENEKGTG